MAYDFQQLSPHDLETLVRDLLQAEWGFLLESFKTGRDQGIDLRYARGPHNLVVQVKHYIKTGIVGLLRDLRVEVAKVSKLNSTRYIIVTSVPLSPANKQAIAEMFGGTLAIADVLGQEDLNNLLTRHTKIEQKHYKLWLASRAVLDRVLHSDVLTQTEFQVEKVHATIRRNVRSDAFSKAIEILGRDQVVIISGSPGVGKTTLANMLLYAHLEKDWEPVVIRRDIAEGQKLFQRGKLQIFYFDDFMGATFLGDRTSALLGNEDRGISDFIDMVRASSHARLILTTREHILRQALSVSERLRQTELDRHKLVLRIGDYTFRQKAKILYNHLYFGDLPDEYKDVLLGGNFYLEIVQHPKFNPRLIEWLSSFSRIQAVPLAGYREFVRSLLQDPSEVWLHAYEQQLSDAGRSLLLALYSLGGNIEGSVLQTAFRQLHGVRATRWGINRRPEDWATAMSELSNAFIRPAGETAFEVLDPSVIDLMNAIVRKSPENAIDLILGAVDFSQVERVWEISKKGVLGIKAAIVDGGTPVAAAINSQVSKRNRLVKYGNSVFYRQWTAEARVAAIIPLADAMKTSDMLNLVEALQHAMLAEWRGRDVLINDGVEALRLLERVSWAPLKNPELERQLIDRLIEQARLGCRSDELRELVTALDLEGPENAATLASLQAAFEVSRDSIASEIGDCRRDDEFKSLEEDFELFTTFLGVDLSWEMERLQEAYSEYSDYEDRRADDMMEDYRGSYREPMTSDDSIKDMFESLRGDRAD
jgi:hypothetical protein